MVLAIFLAGLLLFFIEKKEVNVPIKVHPELKSEMSLQEINLSCGQNGTVKWTLRAKSADYLKKFIVLHQIYFNYLVDKNKHLLVESKLGKIKDDNSFVFLYPHVKLTLKGVVIYCDNFIYDAQKDKIYLNDNFSMKRTGQFIILAKRAVYDLKENVFYILDNVKSKWWIKNEQK
ncbi:MAG: LPS export ABC transporter periplasmic protein LptC [Desulfonauticus sp.]|nr:LPS export ABC transporter periplasmic protein LptC [Desulfonauticus sp.]